MVKTASTMLPLGTKAPDFSLPNVDGTTVSLSDFAGQPLVVMFICNHCPFVKHLRAGLVEFARDVMPKGVRIVAINSNDINEYPDDNFENMKREAAAAGYQFPYLLDATQEIAKKYQAACTPDFYLFDAHGGLVYRGQFDDARPSLAVPVTGKDLRAAVDALLTSKSPLVSQRASIGCNIKWKPGSAPGYFTGLTASE